MNQFGKKVLSCLLAIGLVGINWGLNIPPAQAGLPQTEQSFIQDSKNVVVATSGSSRNSSITVASSTEDCQQSNVTGGIWSLLHAWCGPLQVTKLANQSRVVVKPLGSLPKLAVKKGFAEPAWSEHYSHAQSKQLDIVAPPNPSWSAAKLNVKAESRNGYSSASIAEYQGPEVNIGFRLSVMRC